MSLWRGPKEDGFRPAINALFRSAAVAYKERVIGVLLTGILEDGVAGLTWIKRNGGIAVVRHPEEAAFPDMPLSALPHVEVDYIKRLAEMPHLLSELANGAKRSESWRSADRPLNVEVESGATVRRGTRASR